MSDLLKKAFADIAVGYSHGDILGRPCYIRHVSYYNQIDYERKKEFFFNDAKKNGLLTNEERIEQLRKTGEWTEKKDAEIKNTKIIIESLSTTKANAKHPSMIAGLNKQIKQQEEIVSSLENERANLIGLTCEVYAEREINDYYVSTNIFKDVDLKYPLLTDSDVEYISNSEIANICVSYSKALEGCSEKNIKKLAMMPFFQKYFSLVGDNYSQFFGKPICNLTFYQVELLIYASQFKNIYVNNDTSSWPKHVFEDPDVLLDYANTVAKGKQEAQKQGAYDEGTVVVGAKPEDAKALGLKTKNNIAKDVLKNGGDVLEYFSKGGITGE